MSAPAPFRSTGTALRAFLAAAALCASAGAHAQTASGPATAGPETARMIDALKPSGQHSTRNLLVRPTQASTAASGASAVAAAPVQLPGAAAAPVSAPAAPEPAPSLSLPIQFELNSPHVRAESGALLGNLVAAMLSPELKDSRFVIEGHTDASGSAAANLVLSRQRAEEVRLFLVALGVHPSRLRSVGKGSAEPVNPKQPLAAENRRVRVVTLE